MPQDYTKVPTSLVSPAAHAPAITPSDSTPIQYNGINTPVKGLLITGAGNITYVTTGGDTVSLTGCTVGQVLGVHLIAYVKATGTTASAVGVLD